MPAIPRRCTSLASDSLHRRLQPEDQFVENGINRQLDSLAGWIRRVGRHRLRRRQELPHGLFQGLSRRGGSLGAVGLPRLCAGAASGAALRDCAQRRRLFLGIAGGAGSGVGRGAAERSRAHPAAGLHPDRQRQSQASDAETACRQNERPTAPPQFAAAGCTCRSISVTFPDLLDTSRS